MSIAKCHSNNLKCQQTQTWLLYKQILKSISNLQASIAPLYRICIRIQNTHCTEVTVSHMDAYRLVPNTDIKFRNSHVLVSENCEWSILPAAPLHCHQPLDSVSDTHVAETHTASHAWQSSSATVSATDFSLQSFADSLKCSNCFFVATFVFQNQQNCFGFLHGRHVSLEICRRSKSSRFPICAWNIHHI